MVFQPRLLKLLAWESIPVLYLSPPGYKTKINFDVGREKRLTFIFIAPWKKKYYQMPHGDIGT